MTLSLPSARDIVRLEELIHRSGDFHDVRLDRKVACIQELNLRVRQIFSKCLGPGGNEEWIVLAPDREQGRLRLPKILLKLGIQLHI